MPEAMAAIANAKSSDEERKQGTIASQLIRHDKQLTNFWWLNSHFPYQDYRTLDIAEKRAGPP